MSALNIHQNLESFLFVNYIKDFEYNLKNAIIFAVMADNKATTEFLISQTNNTGLISIALEYVGSEEGKEITELLISKGADVNTKSEYGRTALHSAASCNNIEVMKLLILHGADVNAKDYGVTALHYAAKYNHIKAAELLISHGADVNAKDYNKMTALDYATQNDFKEIAELLISNGANINS